MNETALAGQVAFVTGASSGLGRATALALARAGASIALAARSASDLASVANEVRRAGRPALPVACDLADADDLAQAVGRAKDELGPLRVLVNAAATDAPGSVSELSVEGWDRVLAVNLRAVFLLSRLVVPDMIEAGQGTIINVSSVAGKRGWANASAYCASKFALTGFTQALGRRGQIARNPHVRRLSRRDGDPLGRMGRPRNEMRSSGLAVHATRWRPKASRRSSPGLRPRRPSWCWTKRSSRPWASRGIRSSTVRTGLAGHVWEVHGDWVRPAR